MGLGNGRWPGKMNVDWIAGRERMTSPVEGSAICFVPWRRFIGFTLLAAVVVTFPGCFFLHRKKNSRDNQLSGLMAGQQPDKLLYQRSIEEINHGRYDVGRLTLQALLNTYPDSEYLAKAKLAIADSYFQQGGTSGLTESEAEYKDFITFFPTAPEAPMAQYRVGMAHFRLMGKSDRDLTEARLAEAEFKEFLLRYSDSPMMPRAKARLREVQEVLATGDYNIARFYYEKRAKLAARSRFEEIIDRYPNFSDADQACWYLADTYKQLNNSKQAIPYYDRIITDYPLSPLAQDAKRELAALHQPIPRPTLATLARARADALRDTHQSFLQRFTGTFSSAPNLAATRHGPVILESKTGEAEMAKNGGAAAPNNAIAVQPVNEAALKNGKTADDPKDSKTTSADDNNSKSAGQNATAQSSTDSQDDAPAKNKKGRFHFFKKVIKPF